MNAEVQQQKTSSWREVPESALGQASRLVSGAPGQHSGHRGSVDSGMGKPVLGRLWRGRAGPGRRRGQQGNPEHRLYADRMPGPCHRPPLLLTTDKAASAGPVQAPAVVVSGANGNGGGVPTGVPAAPSLGVPMDQSGNQKDRFHHQGKQPQVHTCTVPGRDLASCSPGESSQFGTF